MPTILSSKTNRPYALNRSILKSKLAAIPLKIDAQGKIIAPKPNMRFVKMGANKELLFVDEDEQLYFLSAQNYDAKQLLLAEQSNEEASILSEQNINLYGNDATPSLQNVSLNEGGDSSSRASYSSSSAASTAGWFAAGTALALVAVGVAGAVGIAYAVNKLNKKRKENDRKKAEALQKKPSTIDENQFEEIKKVYQQTKNYRQSANNENDNKQLFAMAKKVDSVLKKYKELVYKYAETNGVSKSELSIIDIKISNSEKKINALEKALKENPGHVESSTELKEFTEIRKKAFADKLKWFETESKKALVVMEKIILQESLSEIETLEKGLPQLASNAANGKNEDFTKTFNQLEERLKTSLKPYLKEHELTEFFLELAQQASTYQVKKEETYKRVQEGKASSEDKSAYITDIYYEVYKKFADIAKKNIDKRNKDLAEDINLIELKAPVTDSLEHLFGKKNGAGRENKLELDTIQTSSDAVSYLKSQNFEVPDIPLF